MISEAQWKMIRRMVSGGMKCTEIAKRVPNLTAQMIYNKKRTWDKEAYFKDPINAKFHSSRYKALRLACFRRDGFRCRHCGKKGKRVRLEMDHILPRCARPDLTYTLSNVRCLCQSCHKRTPTYGYRATAYKGKV